MYESPINLYYGPVTREVTETMDKLIISEVRTFYPEVTEEELIKALKYDRGQYEKGYIDGRCARNDEIVRCNQCIYYDGVHFVQGVAPCKYWNHMVLHCDFCSQAVRYTKEEEDE